MTMCGDHFFEGARVAGREKWQCTGVSCARGSEQVQNQNAYQEGDSGCILVHQRHKGSSTFTEMFILYDKMGAEILEFCPGILGKLTIWDRLGSTIPSLHGSDGLFAHYIYRRNYARTPGTRTNSYSIYIGPTRKDAVESCNAANRHSQNDMATTANMEAG
jgi:hypothetical protein